MPLDLLEPRTLVDQQLDGNLRGLLTPAEELEVVATVRQISQGVQAHIRQFFVEHPAERAAAEEFATLSEHPDDTATIQALMRVVANTGDGEDTHTIAKQAAETLRQHGIPKSLGLMERMGSWVLCKTGGLLHKLTGGFMVRRILQKVGRVIVPERQLPERLKQIRGQGRNATVNKIGDAAFSKEEREAHLKQVVDLLRNPEVASVAWKPSISIPNHHPLRTEASAQAIADDLKALCTVAMAEATPEKPKRVAVDMELRDSSLATVHAFCTILDDPAYDQANVTIALQASLPESIGYLLQIIDHGEARVKRGGKKLRFRFVKGANHELERVTASASGWPHLLHEQFLQTQQQYFLMLEVAMHHKDGVEISVASHNIFTQIFALVLAARHNVKMHTEVLTGLDWGIVDAIQSCMPSDTLQNLVDISYYVPVRDDTNIGPAMGYTFRRLSEQMQKQHFLTALFNISKQLKALDEHLAIQVQAFEQRRDIATVEGRPLHSYHLQHRGADTISPPDFSKPIKPVSETDFADPRNILWMQELLAEGQAERDDHAEHLPANHRAPVVPCIINGQEVVEGESVLPCPDPSEPSKVTAWTVRATPQQMQQAIDVASANNEWKTMSHTGRLKVFEQGYVHIEGARGKLVKALMKAGKTPAEADAEVDEVLNFLLAYGKRIWEYSQRDDIVVQPKGTVLSITPFNFPLGIGGGSALAALAPGNNVVMKAAPGFELAAAIFVRCMHAAGMPPGALQLINCSDENAPVLTREDQPIDHVLFTGGQDTSSHIMQSAPHREITAELGGKNAMIIVKGKCDLDDGLHQAANAACRQAGQKCSAVGRLMLVGFTEEEQREAVQKLEYITSTLRVGSAWDVTTDIPPLATPIKGSGDKRYHALFELDHEGQHVVLAARGEGDGYRFTPRIVTGVRPEDPLFQTENFVPVLTVTGVHTFKEAMDAVGSVGCITQGIFTDDKKQIALWRKNRLGVRYRRRRTTGAVPIRTPFGGVPQETALGSFNAGTPEYVDQFGVIKKEKKERVDGAERSKDLAHLWKIVDAWEKVSSQSPASAAFAEWVQTGKSYLVHAARLRKERVTEDVTGYICTVRHVPLGTVVIRATQNDSVWGIAQQAFAALVTGNRVRISVPKSEHVRLQEKLKDLSKPLFKLVEFVPEDDAQLIKSSINHETIIRYTNPERVPRAVAEAAAHEVVAIARSPMIGHGEFDLPQFTNQQSEVDVVHDGGSLGHHHPSLRKTA